jgi:isopenicillin-N N-acyltransferase-like protein
LFLKNCKTTWPQVQQLALKYEQQAKDKWPAYHEEMQGVAEGAGKDLLDIVALNVRTEINFGLFSDGCTALSWHTEKHAWLGQNWDVSNMELLQCPLRNADQTKWMEEQKQNLVIAKITQANKPTIVQVTEAGIIGKIGFNGSGVGVLLNAIRVHGMDSTRMPVHFGLRMALESISVADAVQKLESYGMASSAHILIADANTSVGLEFTKSTFAHCKPDSAGRVVHSNHLLLGHPGETDTVWLRDSLTRLPTMTENAGKLNCEASWEEFSALFADEQNSPGAICRIETEETGAGTLFNIVMDLKAKKAVVKLGKPTAVEETIDLEL